VERHLADHPSSDGILQIEHTAALAGILRREMVELEQYTDDTDDSDYRAAVRSLAFHGIYMPVGWARARIGSVGRDIDDICEHDDADAAPLGDATQHLMSMSPSIGGSSTRSHRSTGDQGGKALD